jgi:hypothetical protein
MPEHALTTPIGEPLEQSRKENNLMSTMLPLAVARQHKVPTTEGADIFLGFILRYTNFKNRVYQSLNVARQHKVPTDRQPK